MDLFKKARKLRLISFRDKYLSAEDDGESVCQSRNRSSKNVVWEVECEESRNIVRFKSCFGKYLSASNVSIVTGYPGKKVVQISPIKITDVSIEWEPIRDGFQVRLKTLTGDFLRPNGGLPPFRNSVTHDLPHMPKTKEKLLWDIEIVEHCININCHHRRTKSDELPSRFRNLKIMDVISIGRRYKKHPF